MRTRDDDVKIVGFTDSVNCRNLRETANHNEKRTIGAKAAMPTPTPMRFESFLNRYSAEGDNAKINQATINPVASFP